MVNYHDILVCFTNDKLANLLFCSQIDCTWIIRAEEGMQIYIQFEEYELNVRLAQDELGYFR